MAFDVEDPLRPPADHLVHFFGHDDDLVEAVSSYLNGAVLDGDAAVIIATEAHRDRFRRGLSDAGLDVVEAETGGRLVLLDAAEVLRAIIVGGEVDALAFESSVGTVIERAGASGRRVRAYGEMVALLWADGDVSGAMRLEELWNGLGVRHPFTLFCAYPATLFEDPSAAGVFADVCGLHSEVVGGAPTLAEADAIRRFPRTPHAPRLARGFVQQMLESWSVPHAAIGDALLVASELVTNAMLHGDSDVAIGLSRSAGRVRVVVSDTSAHSPAERPLDPESVSGRGLALVAALAEDWGHHAVDGGKLVWADVAIGARGEGGAQDVSS